MSDQLITTLRKLYTTRKLEALKEGRGDEVIEIIFHRESKHFEQRFILKKFKQILRAAGISDRRVHDMRHTFGSLLLSAGVSPVYVKEQMGHSSITITVDIYGRWIKNSNRSTVNSLDDAPNRTLSTPSKNIKVVSY